MNSWQAAVYTVNPSHNDTPVLTTPVNKGREAMAYLSYIIDTYDQLPSTLTFLHPHRDGFLAGWHTDAPLHDNVAALRKLQLDYLQQNGYVNLRCNHNPGCLPAHTNNAHVTPSVWKDVFHGTSTNEDQYPGKIGAACCAQFAVSRDQVRKRPLSDYVHFRDWLMKTKLTDAKSGRVMVCHSPWFTPGIVSTSQITPKCERANKYSDARDWGSRSQKNLSLTLTLPPFPIY